MECKRSCALFAIDKKAIPGTVNGKRILWGYGRFRNSRCSHKIRAKLSNSNKCVNGKPVKPVHMYLLYVTLIELYSFKVTVKLLIKMCCVHPNSVVVLFLTEGSTYAESTDDSVYDSDSTFYQHTEGK